MNTKNKEVPAAPLATEQDFPIVGIGASRGGLNAFKKFLTALPEKSGMAYVIVQHLDPDYESILPSLLSKVTKVPVNLIQDDIHLAPDNIYVIPSNKTLTSFDGVLKLTPREKLATNALIDVFFTSLAEVHQSLAVGIILTGAGNDGTIGLKAIKKYGGLTFAQLVSSAYAEGMPGSAIDANVVDFILPVEEIPNKLIDIFQEQQDRISEISGTKERAVSANIMLLLQQHYNIDFTHYKQTTIQRRIARRIAVTSQKNIEDYFTLVSTDNKELSALNKDLLIPVTSFFRDPATYEV
jgi:two-component system, chemotaxis family, CheB/CheR fusion protein